MPVFCPSEDPASGVKNDLQMYEIEKAYRVFKAKNYEGFLI